MRGQRRRERTADRGGSRRRRRREFRGSGFGRRARVTPCVGVCGFERRKRRGGALPLRFRLRRRPRQRRSTLDAAEARRVRARLVVAVEERAERVVVLLLDRIVLVVVAARAPYGEPEERRAERVIRALDHVFGFVFGVDRAVLGRALTDAQERGRERLLA